MRFYTTTQNTRGNSVSAGAHKSQITHARGWDSGVEIIASIGHNETDEFEIYSTGGSNGNSERIPIGIIRKDHETGKIKFTPHNVP